jgi:hypothetical protein
MHISCTLHVYFSYIYNSTTLQVVVAIRQRGPVTHLPMSPTTHLALEALARMVLVFPQPVSVQLDALGLASWYDTAACLTLLVPIQALCSC